MLQTIIRSLAENYTPAEVNLYIIDFGSMILRNFAELHHCGGVVCVSDDEKLLGIIAISDTVKQTSIEAINGFKDLKIETYMLTGDNKTSAQAIGKMVGIDNIISEVLPQEKESKVRSLQEQGKIVAMIGDRNK